MGHDQDPRFTPSDAELIKHKVRRIVGRYGFRRSDEEDLQQELALHVFVRMAKFDPSRASRATFVDRICTNKLANLIEHQTAQRRNPGRCVGSLDGALEEMVADGRDDQTDARLDLADAIAGLPPELQRVAICLMAHKPAEAERVLGLTREQLRHRRRLIKKHLAEFFSNFSDPNNQPTRASGR